MKTGNTQSPSRQPAATPGVPGRLSKYIVAGVLTALILAVFLAGQLQAPPTAEAQTVVCTSPPAASCPTYDDVPAQLTFLSTTMTVGEYTTGHPDLGDIFLNARGYLAEGRQHSV